MILFAFSRMDFLLAGGVGVWRRLQMLLVVHLWCGGVRLPGSDKKSQYNHGLNWLMLISYR